MRINKYIAQSGLCSRRKADEYVLNGNVKVNGQVMREPGYDVQPDDRVEVNGRQVEAEEKTVYYLLNKPVGYITTMNDEQGRPSVADLIGDIEERVFPVGRLDGNTSGALILTNDGHIAYRLSHPKMLVYKTYRAMVKGVLSKEREVKLRKGVDIGGYVTKPARTAVLEQRPGSATVEISITEGRYHQVRKMFKTVGCPVQTLERISVGEIRLGRLKEGTFRKLTPKEIEWLKSL
ncbi:MAG: rRNA pseudouridine synthase [Clostridia bacterium]|nr:rRNA pseudouridine synthase [Clostridia bacterium]